MSILPVLLALSGLAACAAPGVPSGPRPPNPDGPHAEAPLVGTWWRLATLGGEPVAGDALPVLIFTERPGDRDRFDRTLGPGFAGWSLLTGWTGAGAYHAPYLASGDTLRIEAPFELERVLSDDPAVQGPVTARAEALADALARTRRHVRDGRALVMIGADGDTLATFAADPPRPPGPLDDIEWVLESVGGAPVVPGTRATVTFSSAPLGPGPTDGFDQVGGYSGCNWFGTGYRLDALGPDASRVTFNGPPMSTVRGCTRANVAEQEVDVQRMFYGTATLRHQGDRLAFVDSTGAERLAFRRHVPYPVDTAALRSGRWRFSEALSPPGVERNAPRGPAAVLAFADSTVTATIGCRVDRGTFTLDGDDIRAEWAESDDSACSQSERDGRFWNPLYRGKIAVTRDRLTLYDEDGLATVFRRP